MKKTVVVNFLAGPGARKSTLASSVFSELKWKNVNCEMAQEYAKDKVWEKSFNTLENQIFVFGKQHHRIWRLLDQTEVVLTDSPLILSMIYDKEKSLPLRNLVLHEFNKCDNMVYFINRKSKYNPKGRMQTEQESKEKDVEVKNLLNELGIKYKEIDGVKSSVKIIVDDILKKIGKKA